MIYVVITTSLLDTNWDERKDLYMKGISQIIKLFKDIPSTTIVIVENTGKSSSYLDSFGIPVLYTNTNNEIITKNKGTKEIKDIFKAIEYFSMKDDDFLIKVTGRYFIHDTSQFVETIKNISSKSYDAVLRYGGYNLSEIYIEKFYSCITGIIGMKVEYVKTIEIPNETTCVEWKWADVANKLSYEKICILSNLGITQYISYGPFTVDS
jgi:hypothetical protein